MDLLKPLSPFFRVEQVPTDDLLFRFTYRLTVPILFFASTIVGVKSYWGDPIDCIADRSVVDIIDTYCWIQSTYSVYKYFDPKLDKHVIYPGVGPLSDTSDPVKFYFFYQWTIILLSCIGAILFIPRYLWRLFEEGYYKCITDGMTDHMTISDENVKMLALYLAKNLGNNQYFAFKYYFCIFLNFALNVSVFFLIDKFLGHDFIPYGIYYLSLIGMSGLEYERLVDPFARYFPKVTKCTFNIYGPGGNIVNYDSLCVLSVNIINEKIFLFLWFWLSLSILISGILLIYHLFTIVSQRFRKYLLRRSANFKCYTKIDMVFEECNIGDWFILNRLSSILHKSVYVDVIEAYAKIIMFYKETLLKEEEDKRKEGINGTSNSTRETSLQDDEHV